MTAWRRRRAPFERCHTLWLRGRTAHLVKDLQRPVDGHGIPARPVGGQHTEHVGDRDDASVETDFGAHKAARIASAVEALIMAARDFGQFFEVANAKARFRRQIVRRALVCRSD